MCTRIVLAVGSKIFLAGLRTLLDKETGLEVVAAAKDHDDAVRLTEGARPDVAEVEVSATVLDGIETTRRICARSPQTRVLCLAAGAERTLVAAALEAGASGFLLKECEPEELTRALRAVARGHSYLSTEASDALVA